MAKKTYLDKQKEEFEAGLAALEAAGQLKKADGTPPSAATDEKPVTPPAEPAPEPNTPEPAPVEPVAPEPVPAPSEPPADDAGAIKAENESLKHQLSVLKGKYNSEVAPLARELAELKRNFEVIKAEADTYKGIAMRKIEASSKVEDLLDAETIERFGGPETAQAIINANRKLTQPVTHEIEALKKQLREQSIERFTSDVANMAAGGNREEIETINTSPEFLSWLQKPDELGRTMEAALIDAENSLDAVKAAKVFKAYKDSLGTGTGAGKPASAVKPIGQQQVRPKPSQGAIAGQPVSQEVYTVGDYTAMVFKYNSGKISKAEMDKFLVRWNKAMDEGRIRG